MKRPSNGRRPRIFKSGVYQNDYIYLKLKTNYVERNKPYLC